LLKFTRSYGDTIIRMLIDKDDRIVYSAYDVATALGLQNKRIAVNKVVIEEKGLFLNQVNWDSEKDQVLFASKEYIVGLAFKVNNIEITKSFLNWLIEVQIISKRFNTYNVANSHYATTQIAKQYGLSAKQLNEILHKSEIQYKVNDQWVLYSKYQGMDLTVTTKIKKFGSDEYVLHTYWTEKGANFIEQLLEGLGHQRQGQLSLFDHCSHR
jgi:phage antirepressor YoqD-like protein